MMITECEIYEYDYKLWDLWIMITNCENYEYKL